MIQESRDLISRRSLLLAGVAAGGVLAGRRLLGQGTAPDGGVRGLVIRNARALDAETPISSLGAYETPPEQFFVRSHFGVPIQLPLDWRLTILSDGGTPVVLTMADIRRLGSVERPVTIECAGNGRGIFQLGKTSGVQWERGAVSTARWTGVPLGALLERAPTTARSRHFWMGALDRAPLPTVPAFLRSIPRETALGDAFVAYEMNGHAIPLLHGGPLRLIVPGWFGMASTKWLTTIDGRAMESDNYFMSHGYRYADQSPVTTMRVKSVIATPLEGARVPIGGVRARGHAWSGAGSGGIRGVEVSADGGRMWQPARLTGIDRPGAWRTWECDVTLATPGAHSLMARATDRTGATQPASAVSNPGGYGNNSIHEVRVHAE